MNRIKTRLVGSYLLVIFLAVSLLVGLLIFSVNQYYMQNVAATLHKQAEISSSFYNRYLSSPEISDHAQDLYKNFLINTNAQVQIFNNNGGLEAGHTSEKNINHLPDIQTALEGDIGEWKGEFASTEEPVYSVSYPLFYENQVVGVVRLVTSLENVYQVIQNVSLMLVLLGLVVIILALLVSLSLSKTITVPVKNLTNVATQMAQGKFHVRASKKYNDEIGHLAETLNYMAEELMKNERLKNEFISSVSHELRTPLTSIKGWVVTLRQGSEPGQVSEGLEIIEKETDRLTLLLEELLDFSRFETNQITLRISEVNMFDFLKHIQKQMEPRAIRQDIYFNIDMSDLIPVIEVDEHRLKQVMINVIDNAFKFTPNGGTIEISARVHENQFQITVKDTGIGINENDLPNVKQKFYKSSHEYSGSGLGLAISHEIIQLHGGNLTIQSQKGVGTQVEIILPLKL